MGSLDQREVDGGAGDLCDLCSGVGLVAIWEVLPFRFRYALPGLETKVLDYVNPWGVCADCDATVRFNDRESLRARVNALQKDPMDCVLEYLHPLHDKFWAHRTIRHALDKGPLRFFTERPEEYERADVLARTVEGYRGSTLALDPDDLGDQHAISKAWVCEWVAGGALAGLLRREGFKDNSEFGYAPDCGLEKLEAVVANLAVGDRRLREREAAGLVVDLSDDPTVTGEMRATSRWHDGGLEFIETPDPTMIEAVREKCGEAGSSLVEIGRDFDDRVIYRAEGPIAAMVYRKLYGEDPPVEATRVTVGYRVFA